MRRYDLSYDDQYDRLRSKPGARHVFRHQSARRSPIVFAPLATGLRGLRSAATIQMRSPVQKHQRRSSTRCTIARSQGAVASSCFGEGDHVFFICSADFL